MGGTYSLQHNPGISPSLPLSHTSKILDKGELFILRLLCCRVHKGTLPQPESFKLSDTRTREGIYYRLLLLVTVQVTAVRHCTCTEHYYLVVLYVQYVRESPGYLLHYSPPA